MFLFTWQTLRLGRWPCATVDFCSIFIVKHTKGDLRSAVLCTVCVIAISDTFQVPDMGKGNANETFGSLEKALNCLNERDRLRLLGRSELASTPAAESRICLCTSWLLVQIRGACSPAGDMRWWLLLLPVGGRPCIKLTDGCKLGTFQQKS